MTTLSNKKGARIDVTIARRFHHRARGLLARQCPAAGTGLLIERCPSVHTWGMRYPIDVIFLDRHQRVLRIVEAVRPMRMAWCRRATAVIETAPHQARALGISVGDVLSPSATDDKQCAGSPDGESALLL